MKIRIRCALSEEEIREMGYNIDEIIGNTEDYNLERSLFKFGS